MPHRRIHSARSLPVLAALFAAALAPSVASAQTSGWAMDRYEPTPAGDVFFAAEHPWYGGASRDFAFRGGVTLDYARRPLVLRQEVNGADTVSPVISDMLVAHAQFGVAFANRLGIHLSLPFSLSQSGAAVSVGGLGASDAAAVGDPRIGGRVRIFGESDRDPVSFHLGGEFFINAGVFGVGRHTNVTDEGFRGRLNFTLAGRGGPVRWSFGGGVHLRQTTLTIIGTTIGSDLFASAAVGLVALDDRLTIGPELWMSTILDHAFEDKHVNVEGTLGAHYLLEDTIMVGVGIGPGLTQGAGTPAWRGLVNLAYAPSERVPRPVVTDRDEDGVMDPDDVCPDVPMGAHPDPARRGCPLTDTDQDGFYDNEDVCVTEPAGANPDPNRRGCPRLDRDSDGVFDDEDQCADTPQGPNPDPDRRGCPDGDQDHDGVLNSRDVCRAIPQGPIPDPSRPGCPMPDRDCDTVPDNVDHCPDVPGRASTDPARNGCPDRLVSTLYGQIVILSPVYFDVNRDQILSRSGPVLEAVADAMRASTHIRRIRIEGHTDDTNTDEYNLDLSQRRANNVRRWLIQHGIEEARLESRGYGESRPIRPIDGLRGNAQRDARALNRRVMFTVIDPAPEADPVVSPGPTPTPAPGPATFPCPRTP